MTDLVVRDPDDRKAQMETLIGSIRAVESLGEAIDAKARIAALKAWAKAHRQVKEMRLDLLRVEVQALLKVIELGGEDLISGQELEAGRWLASLSPEALEETIATCGVGITTVSGMCRAHWQAEELRANRVALRRLGYDFAQDPQPPKARPDYDPEAIKFAISEYATNVAAVLGKALDDYIEDGVSFEVSDVADAICLEAGVETEDSAVREGVREFVRKAIHKYPPLNLDGTVIPRLVTAMGPEGKWIRIPTPVATVGQLAEMLALREHQLSQDIAALESLRLFSKRLAEFPKVTETTRIGDLLAVGLHDDDGEVAS